MQEFPVYKTALGKLTFAASEAGSLGRIGTIEVAKGATASRPNLHARLLSIQTENGVAALTIDEAVEAAKAGDHAMTWEEIK